MGGRRRKCHSILFSKIHKFCYFQVLLSATAHHTHYKTPRSNSCVVEVCQKAIFCFLLVIIVLSLPSSIDRVLNDQELQQHSTFKGWLDFNLQIQCAEPGKQPKSIGHGRKHRRIWYATSLYGADLPALSLNGIEGCHDVHPPSGQELMEHRFQEAMTKGSARVGDNICLYATPVQWRQEGSGHHVSSRSFYIQLIPGRGALPDLPVNCFMYVQKL